MTSRIPTPTPIYRFLHLDNLSVCLSRGALHAPNHAPSNGLGYRTIHNLDIQMHRRVRAIPCEPGGTIHDYVSFYFGPRSPMLYQLHTARVEGYTEGQEPLIYLVSSAQTVQQCGSRFVFSDGHGIAKFTNWYNHLSSLSQVDWSTVYARFWADTVDDMDRQRRKQAEFLIYRECGWSLINQIAVENQQMKKRVDQVLSNFDVSLRRPIRVQPDWDY